MDLQTTLEALAVALEGRAAKHAQDARQNEARVGLASFTQYLAGKADEATEAATLVRDQLDRLGSAATFAGLCVLLDTLPPGFSGKIEVGKWHNSEGGGLLSWSLQLISRGALSLVYFRRESPTAEGLRRIWQEEVTLWLAKQAGRDLPAPLLAEMARVEKTEA